MNNKIRVAVIFGGTNTEHEVSLQSARAVIENIDPTKFEVHPIKITKDNRWVPLKMLDQQSINYLASAEQTHRVGEITTPEGAVKNRNVDIIFPILHGPYGEDGTIQGMLELMHVPYVGCGVTASAVCMDKVLQKNICQSYSIPLAPYFWFTSGEWNHDKQAITKNILTKFDNQYPLFVKPSNQGSSVGITKAHNKKELIDGIELALTRDLKVLVELAIPNAREIECSVLGENHNPESSVLGEIIPGNEFYDYNAKYIDDNSIPVIPADLTDDLSNQIRNTAKLAFQVLDCSGMARVDFLVNKETNKYYLNELNTIPGFTPISMYPKLWQATGLNYSNLLTRLIELGLKKYQDRSTINLNY